MLQRRAFLLPDICSLLTVHIWKEKNFWYSRFTLSRSSARERSATNDATRKWKCSLISSPVDSEIPGDADFFNGRKQNWMHLWSLASTSTFFFRILCGVAIWKTTHFLSQAHIQPVNLQLWFFPEIQIFDVSLLIISKVWHKKDKTAQHQLTALSEICH